MALQGNLATLSFADLLQLLGSTRRTGTLEIAHGDDWNRLYLRDGLVFCVSCRNPDPPLGRALVALGRVSQEALDRALASPEREGKLLGLLLVDAGAVEKDVLLHYLEDAALASVSRLCGWKQGSFSFREFDLPRREMIAMALSVEHLLMESFRRLDEVDRFREVLPSEDMLVEPTGAAPAEEDLDRTLVKVLCREIDRPRRVGDLRRDLGASEFSLLSGVFRLIESGVVRTRSPVRMPPVATVRSDWIERSRELFSSGSAESAVALLREGLGQDPANEEGRRLLASIEQRIVRDVSKRVPLDADLTRLSSLESLQGAVLTPVEAFILSRVEDTTTVGAILEATPLSRAEVMLALQRLIRAGHVAVWSNQEVGV